MVSRPLSLSSRSPSLGGAGAATAAHRDAGNVVFLSNQLAQVSEIDQVRNTLLKGFDGNVDYVTPPVGQGQVWFNRITAEAKAGKGTVSLLGGLHGDFLTVQQYLINLNGRREAAAEGRHPART